MQDDDNGWTANVTPTFRRIPDPVKPMQLEDECVIPIDLRNCLPSLERPEGVLFSFFWSSCRVRIYTVYMQVVSNV